MPAGFEIAWIFRLKPIAFFVDVILNVSFISIEMATSSLLDLRGIDWSDNETVGGFCNLKKWLQKYDLKIGDIVYIKIFYIVYTGNFAFFTPEILHFLDQKFCNFYTRNFSLFTPEFYARNFAFFTPEILHFLH